MEDEDEGIPVDDEAHAQLAKRPTIVDPKVLNSDKSAPGGYGRGLFSVG